MDGTIALFAPGQFLRGLAARWIDLPGQKGRHFCLNTAAIGILGDEHSNQDVPAISLWNAGKNLVVMHQALMLARRQGQRLASGSIFPAPLIGGSWDLILLKSAFGLRPKSYTIPDNQHRI